MKPELSFLAVPLVAGLPSSPPHSERRKADASIHEAFANAGKSFFGTATDQGLPQTDPNAAIIQANFGQVTGENSMKWGSLAPNQGEYNWAGADFLADWATDNNKVIRGTLWSGTRSCRLGSRPLRMLSSFVRLSATMLAPRWVAMPGASHIG